MQTGPVTENIVAGAVDAPTRIETGQGPFNGIIYVCTGKTTYANMCLASISSLRDWGYSDYIFIITDLTEVAWPRDKTLIHQVPGGASAYSSRHWKTQIGQLSPFVKSIYLDCDILATSNLENIWDVFSNEGIGMALDMAQTFGAMDGDFTNAKQGHTRSFFSLEEHTHMAETYAADCSYYNSGVIFWEKGPESARFFSNWHAEWKRFSGRDQFALLRAIRISGIQIYELPESYNSHSELNLALSGAIHRNITFVHLWDNKGEFYALSKQIETFKALAPGTQNKLMEIFRGTSRRTRKTLGLLLQAFIRSPSTSFSILLLVYQPIFSRARYRYRKVTETAKGWLRDRIKSWGKKDEA